MAESSIEDEDVFEHGTHATSKGTKCRYGGTQGGVDANEDGAAAVTKTCTKRWCSQSGWGLQDQVG